MFRTLLLAYRWQVFDSARLQMLTVDPMSTFAIGGT